MTHDDYLQLMALLDKAYVAVRYLVVVGWMCFGALVFNAFRGGAKR